MVAISIQEFEARFEEVMAEVEAGAQGELTRDGEPVAILKPVSSDAADRE